MNRWRVPAVGLLAPVLVVAAVACGDRPGGTVASPTTVADRELEVFVSASGGGGLVDSVGVSNLEVVGGTGDDTPWFRFALEMGNCCAEPNTVVFAPGEDGWTITGGEPAMVRVVGPACGEGTVCDETGRRVELLANRPTPATFEVYRGGRGLAPLRPGTITVELAPMFDFAHPSLDDEPMTITLRFDVGEPRPAPSGDTTPVETSVARVTTVGGGFDLLRFPFVAVADDEAELAAILRRVRPAIDVSGLVADWASHAAVVLAIPTDACPPVLADFEIVGRQARPVFVNPGYHACNEPLLSHTVIAAVDRAFLGQADEIVLPADPPFFRRPRTAAVGITPPDTPEPVPVPAPQFGDVRGHVPLPPRGEVTTATLDDGTPVFVVHHHDGTVSVLDPRAPAETIDSAGELNLARWTAATRNFLGAGAWDEYGRRLDRFRRSDLQGYATRVDGDRVAIGEPVPAPAGSPIAVSADPPAMAHAVIDVSAPMTLEEALRLPAGHTAVIDAAIVVDSDGAHVCTVSDEAFPLPPCPSGSAPVEDIGPLRRERRVMYGPLVATRTEGGFARVAPTGGYAGEGL